jgi:hypothetical protein
LIKNDSGLISAYSNLSLTIGILEKSPLPTIFEKKKAENGITKELILNILREYLNEEVKRPKKRHGKREVFIEENVPYGDKEYLLVF